MADVIKQIKDCICNELYCTECPFYWRRVITDDDEVKYDKKALNRCVTSHKDKTMQQIYERWKDELTPEEQEKVKEKLNKKIIITTKE